MGPEKTALLDTIQDPSDLRKLTVPELKKLAAEVRERIIDVVSRNGGHLAPSLGTVELTIALHYIYNTPQDRLVWDVGHQSYTHKLLTGRREQFATLRQYKGLSGFPKREESPYDTFDVGHAGTSISAALGQAIARDKHNENYAVLAVIGDGALTSGLALEGLNNAGMMGKQLTIILNDNRMSISRNVGALSTYLTRMITDPIYNRLKDDVWELTGRLSRLGSGIRSLVKRIEGAAKSLLVPGKWFEDLGFRYLGPINGHNLSELVSTFKAVKKMAMPVLVHVVTTKGKGYIPAEEDSERFHGIGVFEKSTGTSSARSVSVPTYSTVFGKTMVDMGKKDPTLIGITAAMAEGTGLRYFAEAFPERFFDVGIAEQHAVTFAAGLAVGGFRPVVAIYSSFLQRSFDQIIHDVALQKLPVIFALDRSGLVGEDGPTHHGSFDLSYLRQIPNLAVMAPKDEKELAAMLWACLDHTAGPAAIRYPRGAGVTDKVSRNYSLAWGKGELIQEGEQVALLAVGKMVQIAWEAARLLAGKNIRATVVNMRFIKPLDDEMLDKIFGQTKAVVCLEDNAVAGGFGSSVLEWAQRNGYREHAVELVGLPDEFVEQGSLEELFRILKLDAVSVAGRVQALLRV